MTVADDTVLLAFRMFDIALWILVTICLVPAFFRTFTTGARPCDDLRTAMFFVGVWITGNYMIRLTGNETPSVLAGLNAMAAAAAIFVLIIIRQGRLK